MRTTGRTRALPALSAALLAWLALASPTPARAEIGDLITARRALGLVFVGGSAALTVQGFDYREEADDFYDAYKVAVDPVEIDRLYQRTTNRDVKAQVSWALATAFGLSGLRLLLAGDGDLPSSPQSRRDTGGAATRAAARRPAEAEFHIGPVADGRQVGLQLCRRFY